MKRLVLLVAGVMISSAHADGIKLPMSLDIGNDSYSSVSYMAHDAAYVTFAHESGISRVTISKLPELLQKLLSYDAQAADRQLEAEKDETVEKRARPQAETIVIHGKLIANTEKGLFVSVTRDSGETRQVQTWNEETTTQGSATEDSSAQTTHNSSKSVQTEEPIYETVFYLVSGNPRSIYLKPGTVVNYRIIPGDVDAYKGEEAITAAYVQTLE
jgi:hypothetical protein